MKINNRGYWENMSTRDIQREHAFDPFLANALKEFFALENIKTIVDFGCGLGKYTKLLNNDVTKCDGFDGNPNTRKLTYNMCNVLDLSEPVVMEKPYDWVLSLEVGEHLPPQYEGIFIDNICNNTKYGIVLSWAVKGQGGKGHFNEQNNDYVIDKVESKGFKYDGLVSKSIREQSSLSWFKNTVMVFRKVRSITTDCVDVPLRIIIDIAEHTNVAQLPISVAIHVKI